MPRETWAQEDIDFLKANHHLPRKELAARINYRHTENAVRGKLMQLRLVSKKTASERCSEANNRGDGQIGEQYGMLTIIGEKRKLPEKKLALYWVLCHCSNCDRDKLVSLTNLRRGRATNCGCVAAQKAGDRTRTHGMSQSRLYRTWAGVKSRCYNSTQKRTYKRYGARGIRMCDEWKDSFEAFADWAMKNGYRDDLKLERKDNDKDYEPSNCMFADDFVQANNRSNNRRMVCWGEEKTVAEWSRDHRCLVSYDILLARVGQLEWPVELAMTTPARDMSGLSAEEHSRRVRARQAIKGALKWDRITKNKMPVAGL